MATLYVENVPEDLYAALRQRARQNRQSIAAEILVLLRENIPTAEELKRRKSIAKQLGDLRSLMPANLSPLSTTEQMLREDRDR